MTVCAPYCSERRGSAVVPVVPVAPAAPRAASLSFPSLWFSAKAPHLGAVSCG